MLANVLTFSYKIFIRFIMLITKKNLADRGVQELLLRVDH